MILNGILYFVLYLYCIVSYTICERRAGNRNRIVNSKLYLELQNALDAEMG